MKRDMDLVRSILMDATPSRLAMPRAYPSRRTRTRRRRVHGTEGRGRLPGRAQTARPRSSSPEALGPLARLAASDACLLRQVVIHVAVIYHQLQVYQVVSSHTARLAYRVELLGYLMMERHQRDWLEIGEAHRLKHPVRLRRIYHLGLVGVPDLVMAEFEYHGAPCGARG